jgi:hypothetical protein
LNEPEITEVKSGGPKSAESLLREYRQKQAEDGPAERWRKPIRPVAVEDDPSTVTFDGNVMRAGYRATFDQETIERFRQGYACIRCWEPQETPFPEACSLCGYSMQALQRQHFQEEFEGERWFGPTTSLTDEYERMLENGQRRRHQPGSSIWLPSGVSDSAA